MSGMFVRSLKIVAVVSAYWAVSISLVFLNKHLLSSDDIKLEAPLFITWYQCVVCVGVAIGVGLLARKAPDTFSEFSIRLKTAISIMPLSIVFVGMISFNNLSLKYLGVAFYTVGRSLTTVFNVVLTYFVLNTTTSMQTLLCCAVIITGFLLGVNQEGSTGHLSYGGVICGVMASLFVALNAVYSKRALPLVNNNPWKLNYYNCLNGMFLFIPFMVLFGEVDVVASYPRLTSSDFWFVMTFTGIVGSLLGFVAGLQIKVTSALTHNISGTAKACLQTVMVVVINKEVKSFLWWLSNAMVLVGSAVYVMVRRVEMKMEMGVENKEKESDTEEDAVRIETSDDVKSNL